MHRSNNPWASDWLKRYDKEGIEGLKDRTKKAVDHPPKYLKRAVTKLRKRTKRKQQRLDHKTDKRVNHKEKRYQISLDLLHNCY